MKYSLGDVLLLADKSVLNPWLTGPVIAAIKVAEYAAKHGQLSPVSASITARLRTLYWLFGWGLVLRANRNLSRKALNNGTAASFDWTKEIVLITGGAGGIGASAALKLSSKSKAVIVLDVLPLTYPAPANLHYYRCDLTNYDELQAVASQLRNDVGTPTCVVANAGICRGKTLLDASPRDIELTFGVNSLGLLWTAKTFLPAMAAANHGHFLIMASQTSHLATAGVADYCATKAAALAIYEGLQTEMKHSYNAPAVRVSCVQPSGVSTKMFTGIKAPEGFVFPRMAPEDVGGLVADILWTGRAQNVMIPAAAYISPWVRALPEWLRIGMQDGAVKVFKDLNPHKPLD